VPSVHAKEGPLAGRRLQVDAALTFGRGQADVVVDDLELSRRHAVLRAGDDFFEIEDLDSLNGTWVNGSRISGTVHLEPGDVIRLGKTVLEVVAEPVPAPRVPEPAAVVDVRTASSVDVVPVEEGRCSECNAEVSSQSRFCSYCGAALRAERRRTSSGVQLPVVKPGVEAARGQSIPGVPAGDELRPVTALFADVVGSTALGERLAPDEVKSLIGECVNRIAAAVEQFGGTVQAYMGDGIAAFFGLPAAHEDDPDRAAHAALRVLEVVAEYSVDIEAAWGVTDFNVRVGVNSGQTAVGVVGAADQQQVALGDATNVAARLQSIAAPGTAVVGESTARRLAHRFVLESLGEVEVKGRTEPVGVWRLVRFHTGTRVPAPTPLVGREAAVAQIRGAIDDVVEGRGQVLLLMGDAGFGKSRLLRELETVAGDRVTWLEGQCRSYGGELLYWPFVEVLRCWIGVEAGEPEVSVRTKLRAKVATLGSIDPAEVMPGLARLLSIRVESPETESRRQPAPEETAEAGIQDAVCTWIEALSARQPVVLAIDDFQWADPQARELAEALLRVTDRAPLLFAVALRSDPSSEGWRFRLNALEHFSHRILELTLGRLSDSAAEELLAMLVPEGLDETARQELVSRAEGNPLYVEELLRSLIEGGELERLHRTWALTSVPGKSLPPALEGLLMARFDRLPERARRLAQIAAVVGRTFPADVLARLGGNDVDDALSVLLRAQFIRELHRYPQLVYSFKHGLLQEAVLSTLTSARRQELYGRVAAVFEETAASREEHLELLAFYYARSRNLPKACEYLELAGARAASLNARAQALELWGRAGKLAAKLDDPSAASRIAARVAELDGDGSG
jgi:class 3 adenylate cyclase